MYLTHLDYNNDYLPIKNSFVKMKYGRFPGDDDEDEKNKVLRKFGNRQLEQPHFIISEINNLRGEFKDKYFKMRDSFEELRAQNKEAKRAQKDASKEVDDLKGELENQRLVDEIRHKYIYDVFFNNRKINNKENDLDSYYPHKKGFIQNASSARPNSLKASSNYVDLTRHDLIKAII